MPEVPELALELVGAPPLTFVIWNVRSMVVLLMLEAIMVSSIAFPTTPTSAANLET
ncbi:MAG: hypothetical protein JO369_01725 [Paucibacter sp.]|nr:hypothetical protein [Roseateles sp.]